LTAPHILYAKVVWINSHTRLDHQLTVGVNRAPDPRWAIHDRLNICDASLRRISLRKENAHG